ncbi:LLM class flavin-dependent oxidoreductase [Amycolatopsis sp. WAC 04182]|uniref:LLM class flavin-dependent oxidoreductase n=1 Tax=Amycolatopsis sp. WAC 04182 TaxID=2203198 RepID=UPI000F7B79B5|nr:LLM class flavin-dependent oxidoreductase [Amycolatopsis sp. WAC 04182]RSN56932.1 LLM class flavin-dependent oxidoreductase [Amycolatopsis sp. WAC 04182]
MASAQQLHLGVALDGAGQHPAAWRVSDVHPAALFTAAHYLTHAKRAEAASLDFVTLDDTLALQPGGEEVVRGRLDALLTFAAIAPVTSGIGLVPTVTTTHTEPFHISTAVASLDFASRGRAGVLAVPSRTEAEVAHFGRRTLPSEADAEAENAEVVDVIARLWDSWEDGAIIRDEPTGRFIDREKLHYVDFAGRFFSIKGPSITPRPPQGHPVVAVYGDSPYAHGADVVLVDEVRGARERFPDARLLAGLSIVLAETEQAALERRRALDAYAPFPHSLSFTGTPADLATELLRLAESHALDGFHIRPAVLPDDLALFTAETVPTLQAAGAFRQTYTGTTLRDHLGLGVAANQYAEA